MMLKMAVSNIFHTNATSKYNYSCQVLNIAIGITSKIFGSQIIGFPSLQYYLYQVFISWPIQRERLQLDSTYVQGHCNFILR